MMRINLKLPRPCVVDTGPIMILSGAARLKPSIKADFTFSISAFTIASMAPQLSGWSIPLPSHAVLLHVLV
jgi:hypothetical protein